MEALPEDPLERLAAYGALYGKEVASMVNLVRILGEVREGQIKNGRQMAKELGIPSHKTHAATGALFAAWEFLEQADLEPA
jgi:hypothetical protein